MKKFVTDVKKKYPKAHSEALKFFFPTETDLKEVDLKEGNLEKFVWDLKLKEPDLRKIDLKEASLRELIFLNSRVLYDFFDKQQIAIFVIRDAFFTFSYEILNVGRENYSEQVKFISEDTYPNRTTAEMDAFEKAFEILNKQLK